MAYSGIGAGALFAVNIDEGTVHNKGGTKELDETTDIEVNDESKGEGMEEVIEDPDKEDDGKVNTINTLYLLDAVNNPELNMDKELKSANGVHGLNAAHMVMGVQIEKFMGLGPSVMSQGGQQTNRSRKKESSGLNGRTSVVLCAIHKLKAEQFDTFGIYDGKDQNIGEFKAARCYDVPSELRNPSQVRPKQSTFQSKYSSNTHILVDYLL
jgi:hypothetical protein